VNGRVAQGVVCLRSAFGADRCGAGAVKLGACLLGVLAVWGLRGILPTGVQEG